MWHQASMMFGHLLKVSNLQWNALNKKLHNSPINLQLWDSEFTLLTRPLPDPAKVLFLRPYICIFEEEKGGIGVVMTSLSNICTDYVIYGKCIVRNFSDIFRKFCLKNNFHAFWHIFHRRHLMWFIWRVFLHVNIWWDFRGKWKRTNETEHSWLAIHRRARWDFSQDTKVQNRELWHRSTKPFSV